MEELSMNSENEFLNWGDSFVAQENEFVVLPEGEYQFTVTGFERKNYDGNSDKIPNGTPYAELSLEFTGNEGKTTVTERLYLLKRLSWKLTEFFGSIGQNPVNGQAFNPNWNTVLGSTGRAELVVNSYKNKDGQDRKNNRVKKFLKPAEAEIGQSAPVQNQQPTQQTGFQPGAF
jgi:hypothetical protein